MVENDLKPCYVFDGKPPQLKSNVVRLLFSVLQAQNLTLYVPRSSRSVSRTVRRRKRTRLRRRRRVRFFPRFSPLRPLTALSWAGTAEDVDKLNRRQVKVTREHNEECRKLLTLMGIPWVEVRFRLFLMFFA